MYSTFTVRTTSRDDSNSARTRAMFCSPKSRVSISAQSLPRIRQIFNLPTGLCTTQAPPVAKKSDPPVGRLARLFPPAPPPSFRPHPTAPTPSALPSFENFPTAPPPPCRPSPRADTVRSPFRARPRPPPRAKRAPPAAGRQRLSTRVLLPATAPRRSMAYCAP